MHKSLLSHFCEILYKVTERVVDRLFENKIEIEEVYFTFTWCLSHAEFRFPHLYPFKGFDMQEKKKG